jgi:sphingomyelin phosphodiesterase 2
MHPPAVLGNLTDEEQITVLGVTCDSKLNTFRPPHLEKECDDPNAKRIDYIFTSPAMIESAEVVLTERIPEHNINYSDHFGVSVELQLPVEHPLPNAYLSPQWFANVVEITAQYSRRQKRQSAIRLSWFCFALALCIALHVAIWFAARQGVRFFIVLISTVSAGWGFIDGLLIGVVWARWEKRALQEFAHEMDLAASIYAQEGIHLTNAVTVPEPVL